MDRATYQLCARQHDKVKNRNQIPWAMQFPGAVSRPPQFLDLEDNPQTLPTALIQPEVKMDFIGRTLALDSTGMNNVANALLVHAPEIWSVLHV